MCHVQSQGVCGPAAAAAATADSVGAGHNDQPSLVFILSFFMPTPTKAF